MYGMQMPGSMPFIQTVPAMQTMPSSTAQSSGEMSLLMSESKIHHGEIKSAVNRVTERIDDLMLKVSAISLNCTYIFCIGNALQQQSFSESKAKIKIF